MLAYSWQQNTCRKCLAHFCCIHTWHRLTTAITMILVITTFSVLSDFRSHRTELFEAWPELQFQSSQKTQEMRMLHAVAQAARVMKTMESAKQRPLKGKHIHNFTFRIISRMFHILWKMLLELLKSNLNGIQTCETKLFRLHCFAHVQFKTQWSWELQNPSWPSWAASPDSSSPGSFSNTESWRIIQSIPSTSRAQGHPNSAKSYTSSR